MLQEQEHCLKSSFLSKNVIPCNFWGYAMAKKDKFNDYVSEDIETNEDFEGVRESFEYFVENVDFNAESEFDCSSSEVDKNDKDYKKFEKAIKETKIFEIDKEKNPAAFEYERDKLLEHIFLLRRKTRVSYDTKYAYSDFSLEIVMAADRCIRSFDPSRGTEFLHYLNRAISMAVNCACAEEKRADCPRPPKTIKPIIKKIKKYMQYNEIETVLNDDIEDIASYLDISKETVREAIEFMGVHLVSLESGGRGKDGESKGLIDLPDDSNVEDDYIQKEKTEAYMLAFEKQFAKVTESQRYIISTLATALFCERIVKYKINVSAYSFIVQADVIDYIRTHKIKRQSELAKELGVDNATINVPWNRFLGKIAGANGGDISKKSLKNKNKA